MKNWKIKEEMPINICFINKVAKIRKQKRNHNSQIKKYKFKDFKHLSKS